MFLEDDDPSLAQALMATRRSQGEVTIEGDEGAGMLAGTGSGLTGIRSQRAQMGLAVGSQPGTIDHHYGRQHKCRNAQHVCP